MVDLATQAGTSVGLLYYHFGSKEDLYFAIWSEYQADQEARVDRALRARAPTASTIPSSSCSRACARTWRARGTTARGTGWCTRATYRPGSSTPAPIGRPLAATERTALSDDSRMRSRVMMATLVGFLTEVTLEVVRSQDDDEAAAVIDEAMLLLGSLLSTFVHVRRPTSATPPERSSRRQRFDPVLLHHDAVGPDLQRDTRAGRGRARPRRRADGGARPLSSSPAGSVDSSPDEDPHAALHARRPAPSSASASDTRAATRRSPRALLVAPRCPRPAARRERTASDRDGLRHRRGSGRAPGACCEICCSFSSVRAASTRSRRSAGRAAGARCC